jgi:VWFA-related protein
MLTSMRRIVTLLLLFPLSLSAQKTSEEITVERILIDARVTDYSFDPILGLGPEDFVVKVDGKTAKVESVLWIPETVAAREVAEAYEQDVPETSEPLRRLFIWFVQTDFAREPSRVGGQLHFLPYAQKMIDALEPGDRVAVFSFDSHMKFHLDFTEDRTEIENALRQALTTAEPEWPRLVPNPSLASRLDREEMKKAYRPETAFIHIANAVRNIPGPKSMILFGWGLGRRTGNTVSMDPKYPIARYALETSRVTVFALDMTIADYHDLEIGLQKTAADTGGFYAKTHVFPQMAIDRLQKTLSGHYELEVRKPAGLKRGLHTIEVLVKRRGAYVLARSSYLDKD